MAVPGISTLGVLFGYGVESTIGTKPASFTLLERINSIGGISLETEKIDASAVEDEVSKYVAGRSDSGGSLPVTFNVSNEVIAEIETLIDEYKKLGSSGKQIWFEVYSPSLTKAFYFIGQPPLQIPLPETNQNELWTVELNLVVVEYKGLDTAVKPVAKSS